MAAQDILQLASDDYATLDYLAEGAANVVYRIISPHPSPSTDADLNFNYDSPPPSEVALSQDDPRLEGKLVRLRKNLPSTVPVIESQKHFEALILPLFGVHSECLVEQNLFRPSRKLLSRCNDQLLIKEVEGSRSRNRHGVYLAEGEEYGTLITDMSDNNNDYYTCIEFKPKWLAQSPSAPSGSKRCRTCALTAMRSAGEGHTQPSFCPLSLVSEDKVKVAAAVNIITKISKHGDTLTKAAQAALVESLYKSPLLELLRKLQLAKDPLGVSHTDLQNQDFLTAMTLRDCTLFLKVCSLSARSSTVLEGKSHSPIYNPRSQIVVTAISRPASEI